MPTYFAVCVRRAVIGNADRQSRLATAMIEYLTAGIAVYFLNAFNMTLHSATPPADRGNSTV